MELEMNTALDNVELETASVVETHANGEDEAAVGSAAAASSVLIVEDNQDIAYYIGMHLKGYRLLYARGAAEGWQKAQEMMPDLIITDLMMPGEMDGLELCRCVRMSELTSHIPIIIVTAKTTEDDHVKGLQAGADAYLVKPFNSEELLVRVQKLIEQRRLLRDKFAQDIPKDGEKKQQDLTAQDRQFMNRLLDTVHSLMPHGRTDLDSVAERMDMSRSQLCRKTMAVTGQSPAVYIMRLRLVYAKRLLKSDVTLPIGNVAQRCGFEDVAYFSRIFKQQFDMTPSQYRKSE
jgi:DNA-binding response OmpR family regulator